MLQRWVGRVLVISCVPLVSLATVLAGAARIVVVLPGQTLVPGSGVTGVADPLPWRGEFTVHLFVVDPSFDVVSSWEGPLHGARVALDDPPPGEPPPPESRRFGTTVSGAGAATSLSNGSLRASLGGSPWQVIDLGSPATPAAICDAIVTGIAAVPVEEWGLGRFVLGCTPVAGRYRGFFIVDRSHPSSSAGGTGIAIDPTFGSAPLLHLGAPVASSDPADPAEHVARVLDPPVDEDRRFSRGHAAFRLQAVWVSGQGQTIAVDQGTGPALEVLSSPFTIAAPQLAVTRGTVLGDGNGSITQVLIEFNEGIDPSSLPIDPAAFSLQQPGLPPVAGTAVTVTPAEDQGYSSSRIEVTFGSGLPKTDVQDVEIVYGSSTGLLGAHSGTALTTFSLNPSGEPRLIDGAPPVLLSSTALDTDGNGGLDVLRLVFSEPVRFSAGKGMSYGAPHDPTVDPGSLSYPAPSPLRILTSDLVVEEHEVPVVDEGDPDLPVITGATAMAGSLVEAARRASSRPAYTNFTATFENGRYVLRSGAAGAGSSVSIPPAEAAGDLAPLLRLGTANGGIERTGQDSGIADLDDWVVLSADGRTNLLYGQTAAHVNVTGDRVMVELTNVPNSGTSTPTFFWRDEGDGAFLCDRAPIPNCGPGLNNLSLPPDFHPRELLREASSFPGPGLTLQRTAQTGVVRLDATPSIAPTLAIDDAAVASFTWTQVGGPPVFGGVPPNGGVVDVVPLQSGVYEFELTLSIPDATGTAFNPWLEPDRTLRRTLLLTVTPGPQADVIVLVPGQTLVPGVTSASQAVSGTPKLATVGVPYEFEVIATDAFYNEVTQPQGSSGRVTTTDPDDVEPPFAPFVGSRVRVRVTPSDAATVGIPEVDDEVLVAFEQGDVAQPYVVGSLWNATASAEPDPTGRVKVVFHWDGDPRAVQWNIYRGSISTLADLDGDGLPDLGYGSCVSSHDPDPADEEFEDAEEPLPGDGFFYVGTMVMNAFGVLQETSPGITSEGLERRTSDVCP